MGRWCPKTCQQSKRGAWGRVRHPSIPATREILQMAKMKTNLGNLICILSCPECCLTLSRAGSRMSQSLKSPSADSLKVQGGAGILGCSEIATGFSILHISFPTKSSKIPQFLYLHIRICRISSFVCFHQELVWKESKERFCREFPNRDALKQLKSNQPQWVGPLGASAGSPVSSSGAPKAPGRFSAKSTCKEQPGCASQSLCPCSCRDQQAGNTIPWPQCPCRDTLSPALHELGEVVHGGDQPLPLPRLVAGRGRPGLWYCVSSRSRCRSLLMWRSLAIHLEG